jgi:hypothetical protein
MTDKPVQPADDAPAEAWRAYALDLEAELSATVAPLRAARGMAAAIDWMVHTHMLNPRSPAADVRLGYGDPMPRDEAREILAGFLPTFR